MIRSRTLGRSRVCGSALAVMIMLSVALGSAEPAGAQGQDPRGRLVALAEAGRWNEVLPIALALRDKAPRDVTVLIVLSLALRASGDPEGAREAAQSANAIAD